MHFLESKAAYRDGRALVFHNIDYLMMTLKLVQKDYAHLARCLVPLGEQVDMSMEERAEMLRSKTRRFTEEEIEAKFRKPVLAEERRKAVGKAAGKAVGEKEKEGEGGVRRRSPGAVN